NALYTASTSDGTIIDNSTSAPLNLLQNGGFESAITGSDPGAGATGWYLGAIGSIVNSSANAHAGNQYMSVAANGSIDDMQAVKTYRVVPGDTVYAEGWVNTAAGATGTGGFWWQFLDKNQANIQWNAVGGGYIGAPSSWTKVSGTFVVPANAYYMNMAATVRNGSSGTWRFDDVVLRVINTDSPLIVDPTVDSTTAFQVQNASSTNIFTVDTTNTAIVLGNDGTPSALTVRGGAATGTNAAGSNLTFAASNGTGTGGSGDLIFQTAAPAISTPTDDGNDNTGTASSATSLTFSHTVASNANRIIVVGIGTGCGFGSTCAATVSSVTYAGVSLSKLSNVDCTTGAGHCHVELWYLAGSTVATGANNVVVTTSASTSIKAGASSYYNVDPTTPFGTAATATGNGNPSSLNVSSNTNQLVVDVITSDNVINSVSAGQTQRYNVNTNGPIASSTKPGAATTTNMGWSDGSSNYATIGAG